MTESGLNSEQEAVCCARKRPLIVVAGAGTGKTFTLTEMFSRRVMEGAGPESVLGITFTDKAAAAFKQKVMESTGLPADSLWVSTFHAFCLRLLRRHGLRWGLDPDFRILSVAERKLILERVVFEYLDRPPEHRLEDVLRAGEAVESGTEGIAGELGAFLDRMASAAVVPQEMRSLLLSFRQAAVSEEEEAEQEGRVEEALIQVVCDIAERVEAHMHENQCMDFARLEKTVLLHLRRDDEVRRAVSGSFREILVDEFQDTSEAQMALLELLCPPGSELSNLVVVGDPRQSIFGFRGARVENILGMQARYRENVLELTVNYRSHPDILALANDLIRDHPGFEDYAGIRAPRGRGSGDKDCHLEVVHGLKKALKGDWDENDFLARRIRALVGGQIPGTDTTARYRDIAILARTNKQLRDISGFLSREGIPNLVIGPSSSATHLADLAGLLFGVVDDPLKEDALVALLESPLCGADDAALHALRKAADDQGVGLHEGLLRLAAGGLPEPAAAGGGGEGLERLATFGRFLEAAARKNRTATLEKTVEFILEESGFDLVLQTRRSGAEAVTDHIRRALLEASSAGSGFSSLRLVSEYLIIEARESLARGAVENILEAAGDVVLLLTVHTAKGLEFPVVFLPSVHGARFPSYFKGGARKILYHEEAGLVARRTRRGDTGRYRQLEEDFLKPEHALSELRLLYVAVTRAKHLLILSENHKTGTAPYLKKVRNASVAERILFYGIPEWEALKEKTNRPPVLGKDAAPDFALLAERAERIRTAADRAGKEVVRISPTDAVNFDACPYRYFLARANIPREGSAPGPDMARVGGFVHDAIRQFTVQEDRGWPFLGALVEAHPWPEDGSRAVAQRCLENFLAWRENRARVLGAEVPVQVDRAVPGRRLCVEVRGQVDLVMADGGGVTAVDFKTDRDPGRTDHSLQLQLYALALRAVYPGRDLQAAVVYLNGPSFLEEAIPVTEADLETAAGKIERMALALEHGDFSGMVDPERCPSCFWSKQGADLCPCGPDAAGGEPFQARNCFRDRMEYYHYFWDLLCREQEHVRSVVEEATRSGLDTLVDSGICLVLNGVEAMEGYTCRYRLQDNLSRFREGDFVELHGNFEDVRRRKLGFEAQIEELAHSHITLSPREKEREIPWRELGLALEARGVLMVRRMSHALGRFKRGFGVVPGSALERALLGGGFDGSRPEPIEVRRPLLPCKAGWTEENLSEDQLAAVKMVMAGHPVSLVQGPAGTGKTTTVGTILRTVLENTDQRILLASFTNRAVDQMAKEVLELEQIHERRIPDGLGNPPKSLDKLFCRVGRRQVVSEELHPYTGGEGDLGRTKEMMMTHRVVAATAGTLGAEELKDVPFDLAVVDESSQALEPALLSILEKAGRVVLVGDDKQLPPVVSLPGPAGEALSHSLFQRLIEPARAAKEGGVPYVMLRRQFRMHETIMKLAGDLFYEGKLEAGYDRTRTRKLLEIKLNAARVKDRKLREILSPEIPLVFWDLEPETPVSSQVSRVEEQKVVAIVEAYLGCGLAAKEIGVITPYRKQVGTLRLAVRAVKGTKEDPQNIQIDTIDRFQGSEKKVIVFSSLTTSGAVPALLDDSRRLNVAITRAGEKLIILGSTRIGEPDSLWQSLLAAWPAEPTARVF